MLTEQHKQMLLDSVIKARLRCGLNEDGTDTRSEKQKVLDSLNDPIVWAHRKTHGRRVHLMDWKTLCDDKEKYAAYMCSPEWGVLREAVYRRANGICERCRQARIQATHHLTYIRKYNERLTDLQGVCQECHDWCHGRCENSR